MKLRVRWMPEAIDRGTDPNVRARMIQLTSAALISHNIYCEERYTSTDGSRIAILRSHTGSESEQLWLVDMPSRSVALVCDSIAGYPTSNLYRDTLFFARKTSGSGRILTRLDLKTLEQDDVFDMSKCPEQRWLVCTISPDERYFVANTRVKGDVWGLYRVDLKDGTWDLFHQHPHICNPHPQFEPSKGQDILVQLNRGSVIDDDFNIIHLVGEEGATLYVMDKDGGNVRYLPVGKPHTPPVTGHECWVADTGKVILTTGGQLGTELHLVTPGEERSRRIWKNVGFSHISASTDGRFFVTDDYRSAKIYVGDIASGRMLPLCDTGSSFGGPQYTHPHPYMTPDARFVIFNSDRTGLAQVWAAEIPRGFLESLCEQPVAES
jgi:hypothetical protein